MQLATCARLQTAQMAMSRFAWRLSPSTQLWEALRTCSDQLGAWVPMREARSARGSWSVALLRQGEDQPCGRGTPSQGRTLRPYFQVQAAPPISALACARRMAARRMSTDPGHEQRQDSARAALEAHARESVLTPSNAISLARLFTAPLLGYWLLTEQWHLCLPGLALSGAPCSLS